MIKSEIIWKNKLSKFLSRFVKYEITSYESEPISVEQLEKSIKIMKKHGAKPTHIIFKDGVAYIIDKESYVIKTKNPYNIWESC